MIEELTNDAIALLKKLIETQSFSSEEDDTAAHIENWFQRYNIDYKRTKNNVWAVNKNFDDSKPTLLLNSHHDTVKPIRPTQKIRLRPLLKTENYTV